MLSDYLAAGPLIIARLKASVPALLEARPARTLDDLEAESARAPAAFVVYLGDRPGAEAVHGAAQVATQRWAVVLALKNATQGDGAAALMGEAGPLLMDVLSSLSGWKLSEDHRPLVRVAGPRHGFGATRAYFPLLFECQVSTLARHSRHP